MSERGINRITGPTVAELRAIATTLQLVGLDGLRTATVEHTPRGTTMTLAAGCHVAGAREMVGGDE